KFSAALEGSVKLGVISGLVKGIAIGSNGITFAIWGFMTWYGSRMVMYHGAKGGTVFAVIIWITFGGQALGRGLSYLKDLSEAIVKLLRKLEERSSLKTLSLYRPEASIFDDFCLRVPSGKTVALVGGSGSGKSTVISLLQRFYDPVEGEILIDGVSIDKLQVKWLRSQMGLVSQEPALFATSIKENILFGKEDASMEDVVEAAKVSNAHNFISQLPNGYETQVGERGVQMSGGQKQRIAIACAIIKSPTILLLDEATSALDSESEMVVQEALDNASAGRTTIVIAHRLSTIRSANVINVVQNGCIVESGSHEELMENLDGQYTSLVRLQHMENEGSDVNISINMQEGQLSILSKDLKSGRKQGSLGCLLLMLSKILTFEVNWFDEDGNSSGAICSRLAKEANLVRSLVGERVSLVVQTISAVSISCTLGLIISWRLAIVMIAVQPLVVVCYYTQRNLLKSMSKKAIKAQDESSKLAAEAVSNIRTITSFSSQERILKLLKRVQAGPQRESIRQSWIAGIVLGTSRSLVQCTAVLNFWYGGTLIADGKITSKSFFEMFLIFVSTGRVIADAGTMTTDLAKGSDAVGAVFALLDRSTTIDPENPDGYVPEKIDGQIRFLNVDFAYPTRPDGTVRIDGRDIRSYHLRSLRQHISLVSQEPMLFAGTIRENIMYGKTSEKIDESEMIEAAKAANAHDFITSLSDGYDTNCGDRGVQLSGGQKQRIAIARAVLKNPSVLLLDEATSALDSQSERVVQDALERVMVGRTSVVIAHRLSTIQNCDAIAVLDKGKVIECGTHSSLLAKGQTGAYFSLVSLQRT
ncbi:hypothetical protein AALP_AAs49011U000200, partial [Arabis alpina]